MSGNYPLDEFDHLEPSGRKGAHRKQTGAMSHTAAIALIAVLAIVAVLLVFGAVRIIGSSTVDAETQVAETQGAESAEPESAEQPTSEQATEIEKSAEVVVLNASGVSGAASRAADMLEQDGWTIADTANANSPLTTTVVYYSSPELADQAQAVADAIGSGEIEESSEYGGDLTVLLCSDLANSIGNSGGETGSADSSAETTTQTSSN